MQFMSHNGKEVIEDGMVSGQFRSEERGLGIIMQSRGSGAPRKMFTKLVMHAILYFPQMYNITHSIMAYTLEA